MHGNFSFNFRVTSDNFRILALIYNFESTLSCFILDFRLKISCFNYRENVTQKTRYANLFWSHAARFLISEL